VIDLIVLKGKIRVQPTTVTTQPKNSMTEENQNNEETHSHSSSADADAGDKVAQIEALEGKLRIVRWGLFLGVFLILTFGIYGIYNTSRKAIQPAMGMYKEGKTMYEGVKGKVDDAQRIFNRLDPKTRKAYGTLNALIDSDSKPTEGLRKELQDRMDSDIKPAAEKLAKKILVDLQADVMKQLGDISNLSDEIMWSAREEYHALTNSLPEQVTEAIEQSLVKMIASRDERMREMFPKLTDEKQAALVSRLSELSKEQGHEIFVALFADHLSELGKLQDSMDAIHDKEGGSLAGKSNVESTIALLSALLDIAMTEYGTGTDKKEEPGKTEPKPEEAETGTSQAEPIPQTEATDVQPTEKSPAPANDR